MYANHVPLLAAHGKASPSGLADLCTFALLSIRQPFSRVPKAMANVRRVGEASGHLWGWKLAGYQAAHGNAGHKLFNELANTRYAYNAVISIVSAIPGLGLVKGGFVAQMLGYDVGCIDSRNAARLGFAPRVWRSDGLSCDRLVKRSQDYVDACCELGGAETLWNDWCADYARQQGMFYSADDISQMHLNAIGKDRT